MGFNWMFNVLIMNISGPGSSVGIATDYGLDGPGIQSKAVLWMLAQLTEFRLQREKVLTIQDYFDFLKRAKWKLDQQHKRQLKVGNCLSVIETAFSKKQ
jgi:hypothetical protein